MNPYASTHETAYTESRAEFIKLTYLHLMVAIVSFVLVEIVFFKTGVALTLATVLLPKWIFVLGGFMVVGWIASHMAHNVESTPLQYAGLGLYILMEAILFAPILYLADSYAPGVISRAAQVTLLGTAGLTMIGFYTRADFSFLRGLMIWGGIGAVILVFASLLFGWNLGTWFTVGMILFAGAAILYDTSNIIHHFPEDRYVGASLQLFASVALMFWYVLRLFMAFSNDD